MSTEVKRVQFDLPPKAMSMLQQLKEQTEAGSYAEVVRKAIQLYATLLAESEAGNVIQVRTANHDVKELLI